MGHAICSWCQKDMGDRPDVNGTTHSVCKPCADKLLMGTASEVFEAINLMAYPGENAVFTQEEAE